MNDGDEWATLLKMNKATKWTGSSYEFIHCICENFSGNI